MALSLSDCAVSYTDVGTSPAALPAPEPPNKGGRTAKRVRKPVAKENVKRLQLKATLLGWIARLRYLHSACAHPLLQAVALSLWGAAGKHGARPSLEELVGRFEDTLCIEEAIEESLLPRSPLLAACRAALRRCGNATELAICFVALCRALGIRARLVLAFDEGGSGQGSRTSPAAPTLQQRVPVKSQTPDGLRSCQRSAGCRGCSGCDTFAHPASSSYAPPASDSAPSSDMKLDSMMEQRVRKLQDMGFSYDSAVSSLLQAEELEQEEGGAGDCFSRAVALLLEYGRIGAPCTSAAESSKTSAVVRSNCPACGSSVPPKASFCGSCGRRLRGVAATESVAKVPSTAESVVQEEVAATVDIWPEVYDGENNGWVAVDISCCFIARQPVVEWIHRGTPMLWLVAADDNVDSVLLRDVTPRYSPSWWRVQQARGCKSLNLWWDEVLQKLSGPAARSEGDSADQQDVATLHSLRVNDGVPNTKSALLHHDQYIIASALKSLTLKPGAEPVAMVAGEPVYLRSDTCRALSEQQWRKYGREVQRDEQPVKTTHAFKLFAEWQTAVSCALDLQPANVRVRSRAHSAGKPASANARARSHAQSAGREADGTGRKGSSRAKAPTATPESTTGGLTLPPLKAPPKRRARCARKMGQMPRTKSKRAAPGQGPKRKRAKEDTSKVPMPKKKAAEQKPLNLDTFADDAETLRKWLERRGYLPWDKSTDEQESALALWVKQVRRAYRAEKLSPEQVALLDRLDDWSWGTGDDGAGSAAEEEPDEDEDESDDEDEDSEIDLSKPRSRRNRRRAAADNSDDDKEAKDKAAREARREAQMEQWLRLTMQRLAAELARQRGSVARRAKLRGWQRDYHPDKNPGRTHEVLPIFRWVQSCWERDFRQGEDVEPDEAASAPCPPPAPASAKAAKSSAASSPATRTDVTKAISSPAAPAAAAAEAPRRRMTGKRSISSVA
eukprot:gnl/TRDRNA2_/TRDRNA2_80566_c0_seq1.p1 gnl/TRDRNA2_/TRDRNA2_80566_c0~~gnl/TRDRNA2_/TRDRNA2_80566_c0_seq1.p1  ORF type:complete len:959 (-),score=178.16 gnl/TRDRNA2_/TRDRNA2_80566_c0_seq1:50-2926(-)